MSEALSRPSRMSRIGQALCVLFLAAGCLGPSPATAKLWAWNSELGGKWGQEGSFLLLLPFYALFAAGDMVLFNSYYWWTGEHLVSPPPSEGEHTFGVRAAVPELELVERSRP